ncbi:MAG: tRNA (adenosine(37)-N6)-threonylcarbamoyltransferase complex ATPase subunit type 1 TsaE [Candidatus Moraniibacteriota bacterium]|nr:MAG: tRNA (adenosine(37)-N6)-threonylcarbamoyltransferase complex ATPase subunit type 1 TsaE [Candidatus Moranbacteria bacterium]
MPIFHTQSAEELRKLGASFARGICPGVVALSGELGAGKTTFSQGILAEMGATGPFTSPTFVIMKQYDLAVPLEGIERIYHVDAYRIGEADLRAQGFAEWASDPNGVVLLEWPERVPGLVPETATRISFTVEKTGRRIEWQKNEMQDKGLLVS